MEEFAKLAANYGFPMVVAFYLLLRLEPLIKELQKTVNVLTIVVAKQGDVDIEEARRIAGADNA
jgi:hypothetical protein